jgi:hypothetical protein
MPFEIVERVLTECSPYQPVVDFIGGEPLLYPNLRAAVKLASQRNILAVVTTNGLKLQDQAEALVREELSLLQVSLDGWDEASQAARGGVKGSFLRLCDGVRAVQEARGSRPFPIIRILTAITRVNHGHLDCIQSVVKQLGITYWGISNYFYSTCEVPRSCLCDLPYTRLDIQTDGHMAVCVSGKRVGEVSRDSIVEVWRGRLMDDYRKMYEHTRPMPMCFRCCGLSQTIRFDPHA